MIRTLSLVIETEVVRGVGERVEASVGLSTWLAASTNAVSVVRSVAARGAGYVVHHDVLFDYSRTVRHGQAAGSTSHIAAYIGLEDDGASPRKVPESHEMRKLAVLLLLIAGGPSCLALRDVTVEQLEQQLADANSKPDMKVAQQLSELELTERLSAARLSRLESKLPGPQSRRSLVIMADLSAFRN